ncbi:MAG: MBL fold metallo-hydrolase, partial [Verrucomicrobiae bacterium]|nr:MBL fold metallo-hydrolase [Verrucomicrobiae bacterium]MCP5542103.1 MBL fold metallo-hydrolase [Akkermansiaceae bacterium]
MKLKFCGAAGTTTGSQHLLEVNGSRILLDCGLYQGHRADAWERNQDFLFDPATLDAVVLSHAHIDHSGNLPNLVRQGFRGNIYSTFATRDLCSIMLPDSARIQEQDVEWINKRRSKNGDDPVEPLYSEQDAELCLRQFVNIGYDRALPIANGVRLTFIDAGHILGSAQVILDLEEAGNRKRLLFSGDVGRGRNELLRDPANAEGVDFLLMESTYGGREHELPTQANHLLESVLERALKKRGKVIIPAFAVERTQQLIYVLHTLSEAGRLPDVPIFVDSPLAVGATEIFRLHPECFNDEVYRFLFEKRDPFGFENLSLIRKVSESKSLNELREPAIIISASGMCEAGRVLHHLRNNIGDPRNTVLFVGYCAENTLGWKIRNRWDEVNIFGEPFKLRANVEILDSFSGHADRGELLDYFDRMGGSREKVWLVHGEPEQSKALCETLRERHPGGAIEVAQWKRTVEL